jgi:hypothetical protein
MALRRFIGIPQRRNPPTRSISPSFKPYMASEGDLQILAKLKNDFLRILPNIKFCLL